MKITLTKRPRDVTIIEGFPGYGLIGTIATEFLIKHMDCEKIGSIRTEEMPAMIAIHDGKVVEPISIYYNEKYNIVLIHALNINPALSWSVAEAVRRSAQQLNAREIVSLEGVGSLKPSITGKTRL